MILEYRLKVHIDKPSLFKNIDITFNRKIIRDRHVSIKKDLETILQTVTEETDLILKDNLARGQLINTCFVSTRLEGIGEQSSWVDSFDDALCPSTKDDPPEYWSNTMFMLLDTLTSVEKYPWMPVDVSEFDVEI